MNDSITYRNFEIKISQDTDAMNPFEDCDGNLPLIASWGSYSYDKKDYSNDGIKHYLLGLITYGQYRVKFNELLEIADYTKEDFNVEFPYPEYDGDDRFNALYEAIEERLDNEYFDTLESLATLFKIPCLNTCRNGYSQGDSTDLFICWTKEFEKTTGLSKDNCTDKKLENCANLYGYWAFGDVYGYSIEDINDDHIDSCWGYYGDDHIESGLIESAKDAIDYHIDAQISTHIDKVKTWIKSKVALIYRSPLTFA